MVSIPNGIEGYKSRSEVVILFDPALKTKKHRQPCIFCGNTIQVQTFKGKTVCYSCLKHIPALFVCG